jgi:hypothetical protein
MFLSQYFARRAFAGSDSLLHQLQSSTRHELLTRFLIFDLVARRSRPWDPAQIPYIPYRTAPHRLHPWQLSEAPVQLNPASLSLRKSDSRFLKIRIDQKHHDCSPASSRACEVRSQNKVRSLDRCPCWDLELHPLGGRLRRCRESGRVPWFACLRCGIEGEWMSRYGVR